MPTWDGAHRLELSLSGVRNDKEEVGVALHCVPWYIEISQSMSNIYNKFAYCNGYEKLLTDIAKDKDVMLYAMKYSCDTRFAQSERAVFLNFLRNIKVLHVCSRGP